MPKKKPTPAADHPPEPSAETDPLDFSSMTDRELLEYLVETTGKLFNMARGIMKRLRALEDRHPTNAEKTPK